MSARLKALFMGLGLGAVLGMGLAQHSMGRSRRDLFSAQPLRRMSALGYLNGHASVESVGVLRDYLAWERHPVLRRRAERIVRRMEAKLG